MEMCYDGALVMPRNYAVMSEDEMMYVEGGMSTKDKSAIIVSVVAVGAALGFAIAVGQIALGAKLMGYTIKKYARKLGAKAVSKVISQSLKIGFGATMTVVSFLLLL